MIAFDLECACGYRFEGWFQSRNEFERQLKAGELLCPECGGMEVWKNLSPVAISGMRNVEREPSDLQQAFSENSSAIKTLRILQDFVEKNFEDVGTKFAEESLKIHFGVEEPRNIRGVATEAEEKTLQNEGIDLLKIPMPEKKEFSE